MVGFICLPVCVVAYYLMRAVYSPASDPLKAVPGWFLGSWVPSWVCLDIYGESNGPILMEIFRLFTVAKEKVALQTFVLEGHPSLLPGHFRTPSQISVD